MGLLGKEHFRISAGSVGQILLGDEIRDWLADGYTLGLPTDQDAGSVPSSERHALVTRQCAKCHRQMRGNVFFKHVKNCKGTVSESKTPMAAPFAPTRVPAHITDCLDPRSDQRPVAMPQRTDKGPANQNSRSRRNDRHTPLHEWLGDECARK
jgi:hypothetical protein